MSILIGATQGLYRVAEEGAPPGPSIPVPTSHLKLADLSGSVAADDKGIRGGVYINGPDLGLPAMTAGAGAAGFKGDQYIAWPDDPVFDAAGEWSVSGIFQISKALPNDGDRYGLISKAGLSSPKSNGTSIEVIRTAGQHRIRAYTSTDAGSASWILSSSGVGEVLVGVPFRVTLVQRATGAYLYIGTDEYGPNAVTDGLDGNQDGWGICCYWHPVDGALINLNGCAGDIQFFNYAISIGELGLMPLPGPTNWLRDFSTDLLESSTGTLELAEHAHPETGFTAEVVADGTLTDLTANGEAVDYSTSAVSGDTADSATVRFDRNGTKSRTATISVTVLDSGSPPTGFTCEGAAGTLYNDLKDLGTTYAEHNPSRGGNARYDCTGTTFANTWNSSTKRATPSFNIQFDQASPAHNGGCMFGGIIKDAYGEPKYGPRVYPNDDGGQWDIWKCNVSNFLLDGFRFHNCWDPVRTSPDSGYTAANILIKACRSTNCFDDFVENDIRSDRIDIEDCLVDGCFVFYSSRNWSPFVNKIVGRKSVITGNLIRMEPFHDNYWVGQIFKMSGSCPDLELRNNIWHIGTPAPGGAPIKWENGDPWVDLVENYPGHLTVSTGNIIVWAGSGAYPFYTPPGFTVTTNEAVWNNAKTDWLSRNAHVPRLAGIDY